MSKLKNPRWEQFITTYHANGHIARDAYAVAYPHVQKIDSRDAAAARLLRTPAVIRRLAELQDGTAKRAEISVETQIAKLEKLRLKAERAGQLAVAHSCVVSAAKLAGIWVEKSENQTNDNVQYVIRDHPTVEEWARRYCRDDDEPAPPGFDVDRSDLSEFERRQAIKDKLS